MSWNLFAGLPVDTLSTIELVLFGLTGLLWNATYIVIIYRGYKDKWAGMPLVALALNFGWEFLFGLVPAFNYQMIPFQIWMNIIWVALDVAILVQEILYGRKDFVLAYPGLNPKLHSWLTVAAMIMGFFFTFTITIQFNDFKNGEVSAFLMNVVMSILFIQMLFRRKSISGQSIYIAIAKFLGTSIFGVLVFGVITQPGTLTDVAPNGLELFLGLCCFFFDLTYIVLLARQYKIDGYTLWRRRPIAATESGREAGSRVGAGA